MSSYSRILSTNEVENMSKNLQTISEAVNNYISNAQKVINSFNEQGIVQSFYASGKFGTKEKEKLTKIANALQKYWEVVGNGEDSMISQTQKYLSRVMENNDGNVISGEVASMPLLTYATKAETRGASLESTTQVSKEMEVLASTSGVNSNLGATIGEYNNQANITVGSQNIGFTDNGGVQ